MWHCVRVFVFLGIFSHLYKECKSQNNDACLQESSESGDCNPRNRIIKWTFITKYDVNRCFVFIYLGCGGNSNRFDTKEACEAACANHIRGRGGTRGLLRTFPAQRPPSGPCSEEFAFNPTLSCRASIPVWSYNQNMGDCQLFAYTGCGGNANRFRSKEECQNTCLGSFGSVNLFRSLASAMSSDRRTRPTGQRPNQWPYIRYPPNYMRSRNMGNYYGRRR